jgi:mono/diheme cytochrome c family protein
MDMNAIITYTASLFVVSILSRKVKLSIKKGTAILIAIGLLLGGIAAASSISEKKWLAPATEATKKNPVSASKASIAAGQKLYTNNCASCHGPSGDGDGRAALELAIQPARLSESPSESDGALFWKITNGKKPMPGYGTRLSETDRWSLINYIRTLAGK